MRKYAFVSIFVVGHQRIILTGVLPITPGLAIILIRLSAINTTCEAILCVGDFSS